jgi:hypothetical protein
MDGDLEVQQGYLPQARARDSHHASTPIHTRRLAIRTGAPNYR